MSLIRKTFAARSYVRPVSLCSSRKSSTVLGYLGKATLSPLSAESVTRAARTRCDEEWCVFARSPEMCASAFCCDTCHSSDVHRPEHRKDSSEMKNREVRTNLERTKNETKIYWRQKMLCSVCWFRSSTRLGGLHSLRLVHV